MAGIRDTSVARHMTVWTSILCERSRVFICYSTMRLDCDHRLMEVSHVSVSPDFIAALHVISHERSRSMPFLGR